MSEPSTSGIDHHHKEAEGRYHCERWDEVVDFSLDPWDPDDDCPWCGHPFECNPDVGIEHSEDEGGTR